MLLTLGSAAFSVAQDLGNADIQTEIAQLRSQIQKLEADNQQLNQKQSELLERSSGIGVVMFLYGTVCALWAQNTGRNAWLWFFLGLFFSFIAVFFLLEKNATDLRQKQAGKPLL